MRVLLLVFVFPVLILGCGTAEFAAGPWLVPPYATALAPGYLYDYDDADFDSYGAWSDSCGCDAAWSHPMSVEPDFTPYAGAGDCAPTE